MSDTTDDAMDDLLSADLDGETSPAEHDRIAGDPELRSRQEELRNAARLAGQAPSPLDAAHVDDSITRALHETPAHALHPRRAHRKRSRAVPWLVAAAVVALAAIGLALIITDKSPSERARSPSGGQARHPASTVPSSSSANAASAAPLGFLGDFATPAALRSELAAKIPPTRSPASADRALPLTSGQADRCATVTEARNPQLLRSNRQVVASATIAGQPVLVFEYRTKALNAGSRQTTRVIATGAAACDERVDFER